MISFALTEDQIIAQRAAADFAQREARPAARPADEAAAFPASLLARAWALGLVQTAANPEATEQPSVLNALVIEEVAYGDAALAAALAAPLGFVRAIAQAGSPAQQRRHLPAFAGDAPRFAAVAHVDAGWRHGVTGARARRTGSGWKLDGAKASIPLAAECAAFLVTAETDDGARAFIVAASAPGVRVAHRPGTLGLRALQMADVILDDVAVSDDDTLAGDPRRVIELEPRRVRGDAERPGALRLRIRVALHEAARRPRRGDRAQTGGRVQARRHAHRRASHALDGSARRLRAGRGPERNPQRQPRAPLRGRARLEDRRRGRATVRRPRLRARLPLEMWLPQRPIACPCSTASSAFEESDR